VYRRTRQSVLQDIKLRPEDHQHTYAELEECCSLPSEDGSVLVDKVLMGAHQGIVKKPDCNVTHGRCFCGERHGIPENEHMRLRYLSQYLDDLADDGLFLGDDPIEKLLEIIKNDLTSLKNMGIE
jgi:hypothetical protein